MGGGEFSLLLGSTSEGFLRDAFLLSHKLEKISEIMTSIAPSIWDIEIFSSSTCLHEEKIIFHFLIFSL